MYYTTRVNVFLKRVYHKRMIDIRMNLKKRKLTL